MIGASINDAPIIEEMRKLFGLIVLAAVPVLAQTEVTLIAPIGIKAPIEDLIPGVPLGIAEQVKPKLKPVAGAEVMKITARGEAEIGVTFLRELGGEPGIDIIGPLPESIAPPTHLVGFVSAQAKDAKAARALLDYLSSADAAAAYRRHRMQPGK